MRPFTEEELKSMAEWDARIDARCSEKKNRARNAKSADSRNRHKYTAQRYAEHKNAVEQGDKKAIELEQKKKEYHKNYYQKRKLNPDFLEERRKYQKKYRQMNKERNNAYN